MKYDVLLDSLLRAAIWGRPAGIINKSLWNDPYCQKLRWVTHFHSQHPKKDLLKLDVDTRNYNIEFWIPATQEITATQESRQRKRNIPSGLLAIFSTRINGRCETTQGRFKTNKMSCLVRQCVLHTVELSFGSRQRFKKQLDTPTKQLSRKRCWTQHHPLWLQKTLRWQNVLWESLHACLVITVFPKLPEELAVTVRYQMA